jgi:single-stranded-DNA-specific exonuclease
MPEAEWNVRTTEDSAARELAEALELPVPIAALLLCRGARTQAQAQAYLHPSLDQMHDPRLLLHMEKAVARLRSALVASEPILICGDYDVDGTIATVLLKTALERAAIMLGTLANVRYHIPHRIRDGYGVSEPRIEAAAAEGVRLVVSVDTGIRAFAVAETASRLGLDLIITDHHLPDEAEGVPRAFAVLNPHQPGDAYPCKDLCGAAVAFKLAQALLEDAALNEAARTTLREKTLPSFLKLLAIATIADAVPLTGENRVIAAIGLQELRKPSQPGLRALMELAQVDISREVSASDVGFRLAPRINAAGRMDIASDVVEMFLERDPALARTIAEKLHRLNDERRATEAEALREIEARLEAMAEDGMAACLVLDDPAWHRGVIGILASRVVDRTGRPALVLAHEQGQAYGSGRSVSGYHLLDALTEVHAQAEDGLFTRFGGHAHAVGFSLPSESVETLRERIAQHAATNAGDTSASSSMVCDAELTLEELTPAFLQQLEQLGPFGNGNEEPLFFSHGVRLATAWKVVKDRHLRLSVEHRKGAARFGGMAWARQTNWAERARDEQWTEGDLLDLAYRLRRNWHPDFGGWELEIVAARRTQSRAGEASPPQP